MKTHLEKIGSFGGIITAAACPICFPKLALIGALFGLGALGAYESQLFLAAQVLIALAVLGHVFAYRRHRKRWLLGLGILSGAAVFGGLYLLSSEAVIYAGLAGLAATSATDFWARSRAKARIFAKEATPNPILESVITCPNCGHRQQEKMSPDTCQFFYECAGCGGLLRPKSGDCCVFCSYGSVKCPPVQLASAGWKENAMDQKVKPSPRLAPLPVGHAPELKENFEFSKKSLGFVPNSMLIMQRRPKLVKAFSQLSQAIWDPNGEVDRGFKRLVGHIASRAAGCVYCMAHTAEGSLRYGIEERKLAAVWEYRTSPLFTEAERVALDFALAAASVPNDVTDEMFSGMRKHWSENQIVEITAVVAYFGFLNRWNDTMGTPLEPEPAAAGEKYLASHGWKAGKHARA